MRSLEKNFYRFCKWIVLGTIFPFFLWLLFRLCIADSFRIPTPSMSPTLNSGDLVVVNKSLLGGRIYSDLNFEKEGQELQAWRLKGVRSVQYNDICVFNYPKHKNRICFVINHCFCKRCVGLPGDSLWIENGFYRNNNYSGVLGLHEEQRKLSLLPDSIFSINKLMGRKLGWNLHDFGPLYIPRQGDILSITPKEAMLYKDILQWEIGKKLQWNSETGDVWADSIPLTRHIFQHNYYFMAGDNVCDSKDSRYWGLVPEEYIIGIVGWILSN